MQLLFFTEQTELEYLKILSNLNNEQINLKKNNDSWTILQIVEHINIVENIRIYKLLSLLQEKPLEKTQKHFNLLTEVLNKVADRKIKIIAPIDFEPKGKLLNLQIGINEFKKNRIEFKRILINNTSDILEKHIMNHPRLGNLNIKEWIVFINGHLQRHTEQIKEILKS